MRCIFVFIGFVSICFESFSQDFWNIYNTSNSQIPNNDLWYVKVNPLNDTAWVSTWGSGLSYFYEDKIEGTINSSNGIFTSDFCAPILFDNKNNLWMGSGLGANGMLAKRSNFNWDIFTTSNSGLQSATIYALAFDSLSNVLWVGTRFGGIMKYDGNSWTNYNNWNSPLLHHTIYSFALDASGGLWVGGFQQGLVYFDGINWTILNTGNSHLPSMNVYALLLEDDGTLWVGTDNGLARVSNNQWTIYNTSNSDISSNYIRQIIKGPDGNIWFATSYITSGGGVSKFDGQTFTVYDIFTTNLPSNSVYSIDFDSKTRIYAATKEGGLAVSKLPIIEKIIDDDKDKDDDDADDDGSDEIGDKPKVNTEEELDIFIPNVFTPNSDNKNDTWLIKTKGVESYKGEIYNRWGQLLFTITENEHWDGEGVPDGVYFYKVRFVTKSREVIEKNGFITLIR